MVAKFSHGSSLYGALSYNQEKVNEGLGKVLATNLVIEPNDGVFSVASVSYTHLLAYPFDMASNSLTLKFLSDSILLKLVE